MSLNTGASIDTDKLQLWYFVSDISLFTSNNQVELGSGGAPDINEYSWNIGTLVNGWNLVSLPFKNAGVIGTPDLNAINWFRVYHVKTGTVTTKIDQISIETNTSPNAIRELSQHRISIYQNTLNKYILTIANGDFKLNNAQIIITNIQGQTVYRNRIQNSKSIEINTSGFVGGAVYIIAVKSTDLNCIQKIIVK
jgi:hypothetical protein